MPGTIRIAAGSGKASEKRDVRTRRASQQQEYGCDGRKQDALQDSKQQHGGKRYRRGIEIDPADLPHTRQRPDVDQFVHGGKDNGSQYGLGKIRQQSREEQQA